MQRVKVGASFIGWDTIRKLCDTAENTKPNYWQMRSAKAVKNNVSHSDMLKLLVLCLFKTGGRVSEVLSLRKEHFDFKASRLSIVVRDMMVLKKFKLDRDENGKPIRGTSKAIPTFRTFPILKDEMLSEELTYLVHNHNKGLLFHYAHNRDAPLTRQLAWHRVKDVGEEAGLNISDHWFRGQRDAQIKREYLMRGEPLDEWFGWTKESGRMQAKYGAIGWEGLELEMLVGRKRVKEAYE